MYAPGLESLSHWLKLSFGVIWSLHIINSCKSLWLFYRLRSSSLMARHCWLRLMAHPPRYIQVAPLHNLDKALMSERGTRWTGGSNGPLCCRSSSSTIPNLHTTPEITEILLTTQVGRTEPKSLAQFHQLSAISNWLSQIKLKFLPRIRVINSSTIPAKKLDSCVWHSLIENYSNVITTTNWAKVYALSWSPWK